MRKLIFTLLFGCLAFLGQAQTVVFSEDFETQPPPGINSGTTTCFAPNSRVQAGGLLSDSAASVTPGSVCILETNSFDTQNNFFVTLSFAQIAKIEFFDEAIIQISTDGGNTWTKLTDDAGGSNNNCSYLGTGLFRTQGSKFGEASYVNWLPGQSVLPDNSFWQTETFDISALAGGYADVRIRFVLNDLNNNGLGFTGKGWFIDDVEVVASFCELIPPNVQALSVYSNTVYYLGPYTVNATATDASGIAGVILNWTINGVAQPFLLMNYVADSTYTIQIPAVNDGDTVCYQISALDASFCNNTGFWPDPNDPTAYQCFVAAAGITYPYCDNFEGANVGWTTSNLSPNSTTVWQLGTPSFAPTNSAHSPVTAWDVDLTSGYQNNANCVLQTPGFSGLIAGTTLSFWQNRQAEAFWDGVRIEWATDTINGPWSLLGSVGCVDCVNWYTNGSINSSGQPAWDGSSNGWIQSSIILDATFNSLPQVWFRFVFTSDGSVTQAGFSIDDFCIALPQPEDVGVSAIILPGPTGPAGNSVAPQVTVKNYGINPQSTFPIEYKVNGVVTGTFNYTGPTLLPGATQNVTLPNFTVPTGTFDFCAYTQLPGDGNNFNDTTCRQSLGIPVFTLTACDDFESGNLGWQDSTTNAAAAQWQLGTPAFGATTGAYSGSNAWDINLTTGYGFGTNAYLTTPIYDLSSAVNPYLSFYRNQNTGASDGLRVYYNANGSGNWVLLGTVNDPDGTNWYNNPSINFAAAGFAGNTGGWVNSRYYLQNIINLTGATFIQFRFEFACGFNNVPNDGVSIDDFCVVQPGPCDVGVTAIIEPALNGPAGTTSNASVSIRNFGTQPQTNIPVEMSINGGAIVLTGTLAGPLAPGVEQTLVLGTFTIPSGQYCAQAYTQLGCDGDASNDTANVCKVGIPTIPLSYTQPYCDDFEGTNVGWSNDFLTNANPQSVWELGTPAFGVTNSAYSGQNAWDVNLTTGYGPNAGCILVSPFFDIAGAVDPQINFWHQWRSENNWDGVRMEYQLDNSGAWTLLGGFGGAFTPPNWIGWYNLGSIISSGQPAWTNTGPGWVHSYANDLSFMNGSATVQFRYIYTSDASVQQDGHTIDDFCMTIPVPLTAAPVNVLTNTINSSFIFPGQSVQFSSLISNPGTTPLDSLHLTLTINGVPFVTDTTLVYTPQLAAGGALLHAFTQTWQAAPGVYDICVITSLPNGLADLNPFDDTTCITISVFDSVTVTSTNPYCTDFESGPQWVAVNALTYNNTAGNDWELGTPNQTIMNGAHSGVNAWAIDIDDNYQNRDSSGLFSPVFAIDQTKCYKLSFWHKYDSEPFADGGTVEYSVDNAQTWNHLGFASSQPQPWFNTPFITALGGNPGLPGWSGTESNWVQAEHDINFWTTGNVIFRWRFASDNTVNNYEGWVIDDVCFEEIPGPCSVGINDPVASQLMLDQNYPNPFNGSTVVGYHLPSAGQVTVTVTDLLGQRVAMPVNTYMAAGSHTFEITSRSLASGIYYYTLEFEGQKITRKMVITE